MSEGQKIMMMRVPSHLRGGRRSGTPCHSDEVSEERREKGRATSVNDLEAETEGKGVTLTVLLR